MSRRYGMAQLTIYLNQETLQKIENAAAESEVSVSRWVRDKIESALCNEWPASFSRLFGSLAETDLEEPEELDFNDDIPRETL
jgi:hypothetical protein